MDKADLDQLDGLAAQATPGPWFVRLLDDAHAMSAVVVATTADTEGGKSMRAGEWPSREVVAACLLQAPPYVVPGDDRYDENAALIAAMRNALPELLRLARLGLAAKRP
ncbi:hypothetical protein [Chelatococcus asaccharovorans]|uniref:hypothetical protein n=1 Tax=Chelatococcus asaccharovorans TaxID=28210 RepID=UPI00224C717B|nr:hypothetical protein [Chelatococcus asaccharovorans]CAH1667740.1 conserved hypothetical protein [Chelatococcus asaccharovorans]CAH1680717.1 conserved hypothetical protein [Chelatococcus asaccharovorans]